MLVRARLDRSSRCVAALALLGAWLCASAAEAALERDRLRRTEFESNDGFVIRRPNCLGWTITACSGTALVDATAPNPVLREFRFLADRTTTVVFGFNSIFVSSLRREFSRAPATGSGATSATSTLRWGTVTGWTVTGSEWCRSSFPVVCTLAGFPQRETVDPQNHSSFYDLGTWSFHGTGFTSQPFIYLDHADGVGNSSYRYSGTRGPQVLVPALSLLGAAGAALALAGAAAVLRSRQPR
jgi:hypothetical protein